MTSQPARCAPGKEATFRLFELELPLLVACCHQPILRLIILAVTSQVRASPAVGEAVIVKWKEAGLLKPSVLKPLVATIEKGLVLRRLGRLEEEDRRARRGVLDLILGE